MVLRCSLIYSLENPLIIYLSIESCPSPAEPSFEDPTPETPSKSVLHPTQVGTHVRQWANPSNPLCQLAGPQSQTPNSSHPRLRAAPHIDTTPQWIPGQAKDMPHSWGQT